MKSKQIKFLVLRNAPKSTTWGRKHWHSSRDIHSHNPERLNKIKRNFLSWLGSFGAITPQIATEVLWMMLNTTHWQAWSVPQRTPQVLSFSTMSFFRDMRGRWFMLQKETPLPSFHYYNWCLSIWLVYPKQSKPSERNNSKHRKRVLCCSFWTQEHSERINKHVETRSNR